MYTYTIRMYTSSLSWAGTNANVSLTLYGTEGESQEEIFKNDLKTTFKSGTKDNFTVDTGQSLGKLTKVRVGHDNTGHLPGWKLVKIEIEDDLTGKGVEFDCYNWFDSESGDGRIQRELYPSGDFKARTYFYKILFHTGDVSFAGTDANVHFTLFGTKGDTGEIKIENKGNTTFENGMIDTYDLERRIPLGTLTKIRVGHDNTGIGPGWFLDKISVVDVLNGHTVQFPCYRWLSVDADDGMVERQLIGDDFERRDKEVKNREQQEQEEEDRKRREEEERRMREEEDRKRREQEQVEKFENDKKKKEEERRKRIEENRRKREEAEMRRGRLGDIDMQTQRERKRSDSEEKRKKEEELERKEKEILRKEEERRAKRQDGADFLKRPEKKEKDDGLTKQKDKELNEQKENNVKEEEKVLKEAEEQRERLKKRLKTIDERRRDEEKRRKAEENRRRKEENRRKDEERRREEEEHRRKKEEIRRQEEEIRRKREEMERQEKAKLIHIDITYEDEELRKEVKKRRAEEDEVRNKEDKRRREEDKLREEEDERRAEEDKRRREEDVRRKNEDDQRNKEDKEINEEFYSEYLYRISFYTGEKWFAGTDANIYVTIYGTKGDSGKINIDNKGTTTFEAGMIDVHDVKTKSPLGTLTKLHVCHDDKGWFPGWYLDKIIVQDTVNNHTVSFPCGRWLKGREITADDFKKRDKEARTIEEEERRKREEKQRQEDEKKRQQAEQQRQEDEKKRQEAERKRREEEKKRQDAEQQRQEEERKRQEAERIREQQRKMRTYKVHLFTEDAFGTWIGTDILFTLYGKEGESTEHVIHSDGPHSFRDGMKGTLEVECPRHLGTLTHIRIGPDNDRWASPWFLVAVEDPQTDDVVVFTCNRSIDVDKLNSPRIYYPSHTNDVEDLLALENDTSEDWTLVKKTKKAQVFRKKAPKNDLAQPIVKAHLLLKGIPYKRAIDYFTDWEIRQRWDKTLGVVDILENIGKFKVIYCSNKMPTFCKTREMVLACLDHPGQQCHVQIMCSILHPMVAESLKTNKIRANTSTFGVVIRPIDDGTESSEVTVITQIDLKGSAPKFIKNGYLANSPMKWIKMMKRYHKKHGRENEDGTKETESLNNNVDDVIV